jgi:hypothetical protein
MAALLEVMCRGWRSGADVQGLEFSAGDLRRQGLAAPGLPERLLRESSAAVVVVNTPAALTPPPTPDFHRDVGPMGPEGSRDEVYWLMANMLINKERGLYNAVHLAPETIWRT